jgi:glycosyltransferase involved in cell wall biosynthesis
VVLALAQAHPGVPLHTSLYDPSGTFPAFAGIDVRPLPLDRLAPLRHRHRLALPLLAPAFSRLLVDAEVTVCSSSGWAHGARTTGAKVVYCHTPARWLYQTDRYLDGRRGVAALGLALGGPALRRWDAAAATTADRYLVNSRVVRRRVADRYGIDADVVPPPVDVDVEGPDEPLAGLEPGFVLCVSRLLPYKNVEAVVEGVGRRPGTRLVVVGDGPLRDRLAATAPANVTVAGRVTDAQLRWCYRSCVGLVAASYEDFGLTPLEAAAFGRPTAALRWGGFLDTVVEGTTGVFLDEPTPDAVARAVDELTAGRWDGAALAAHAATYSAPRFVARVDAVVDEVRRA